MVETNKWSIYRDGLAFLTYKFPTDRLQEIGLTFEDVIRKFLEIGKETHIMQLGSIWTADPEIEDFMARYRFLKEGNSCFNINNNGLVYQGQLDTSGYYFSTKHFFYNRDGEVCSYAVNRISHKVIFEEIAYPIAYRPQPLLEFITERRKNTNQEIIEESLCFFLNSDIWLDAVLCRHCECWSIYDDDRERALWGNGLLKIRQYWQDNQKLAVLNRKDLNNFMAKMHALTQHTGGSLEIKVEGMDFYEGRLTPDGIFDL